MLISFALSFTACSDDDDPIPVEALITEFAITNAGADGDLRVEGVISGFNILVVVPFETDVTALVTDIKLSEGASVVPASGTAQNFSTTRNFVVTNADESNTYQVTVELAEPTAGVITDIAFVSSVTDETYASEINQGERLITVTFNELQSNVAVVESITIQPAGTTYSTSSGSDTLNLATDQTITLSFAGEQTVYTVTANITEAGFNPETASVLLNKSGESTPTIIFNPVPDDEPTRSAAFNGKHVFVASRKEGNHVYYWDADNPSAEEKTLDFGGVVSGGAWLVSDVRTANGNIYVSNMVMAAGSTFKVYKWDGPDDESPDVILEYTVPSADIRLGDAISIIGNPPANGYIFASNFAWPNNASEFYVWEFNGGKSDAPQVITINPNEAIRMGQYGRVAAVPGEPDLLLVTGAEMGIGVMNYQGDILFETIEPMIHSRSFDPHILEYNGGRYLTFTVNREWAEDLGPDWIRHQIVNISEGQDIITALQVLTSANIGDKRVFDLNYSTRWPRFVGGTAGAGIGSNGKPRFMSFGMKNGFIVHEFSN